MSACQMSLGIGVTMTVTALRRVKTLMMKDPYSAYVLVEDFIEDMRTEDPTDLLTDVYVQFETMGGASPIFNSGQLTPSLWVTREYVPPAGRYYQSDFTVVIPISHIGRSTADGSYNVGVRASRSKKCARTTSRLGVTASKGTSGMNMLPRVLTISH